MKPVKHAANILLVDDSVLNVMVLIDILKGQGHNVWVALSGDEALQDIRKKRPDIILLDVCMPNMDGFEVCERLKADEQTCQIPIIFLSALHDLSQKTRAFAVGGVDYVTKPFLAEEVLSRVETHLARGRLQKELERKNSDLQKEIAIHERDKAELRQYRDRLEELVKTRTTELQQEIAERKETERALLESQRELERTFAERLRLETQLRQAQRLEALGTLAGGIAHDFNNILGTMQGYTEFLLTKMSEERQERVYLERIFQAGKRAAELVRRILTFSRAHEQQLIPTDITPLVEETLGMLRATIPANLKIHHSLQSDCPPIMADSAQIHQVLMNVCLNAAQAMQPQGGELRVILREVTLPDARHEIAPKLTEGHYLELTVEDSGAGMTDTVKERLCDPFFTTRATSGGTGLGLSVVHGIVRGHQGEIRVESEPQEGTAFQIFFPLATQNTARDESLENGGHEGVAPTRAFPPPEGRRHILVVDDERDLSELYRMTLSAQGYHVTVCHDGVEALELFQARPDDFDLVLSDQNMPDMNGEELVQNILTLGGNVPIILATGYSETLTREKALAPGIRKFLMKPVETRELLNVVREILDGSG